MNCCFYVAIDRLPLGTVAAIEFLPVIALAALGARTPRNAAALALAVPGVYLLTGVRFEGEPLGVALAFANAALFALYIVLAHRAARHPAISGIDGLAPGDADRRRRGHADRRLAPSLPALTDPVAMLAGIGVGISSSVIPYVADQLAMRAPPARDLRADGRAAARHRDDHRRRRARPAPRRRGARRRRAGHRGRGAAPGRRASRRRPLNVTTRILGSGSWGES